MAEVAGIGDLQRFGLSRRHKAKGVAADIDVGDRLLDGRHMASDATAPSTGGRVMSVLLDGRSAGTCLRVGTVTTQAKPVSSFAHHPRVVIAVGVMAAEARHAPGVHQTFNKIVALHTVLGDLRKFPNERYELPNVPLRHLPSRHSGITNAVSDVIENLAVRQRNDIDRA
jgi:hypothetical protein